MSDLDAILRWLAAITLISLACAPMTWWLGRGLGSAVHGLIRPLGIVIVTALLWWPAAVLNVPFNRLALLVAIAAAGVAGWVLWIRSRSRLEVRALLAFECVWLALFTGYALFRSYQPDIANTEKPMEIALLSSVSRSSEVPAPDPWLAGENINYYYFGYQMIGSLVKLSGVPTSIAFNLALATLFASVGTAALAVGYCIARQLGLHRRPAAIAGSLAMFFVLLAGNLETAWRMLRDPGDTVAQSFWYQGVGWQASRIIVDHGVHGVEGPRGTINEFPAFSFVLGDLHPHVLTYPLLLGIIALAIGLVALPEAVNPARSAAIGALVGLLYVSNSWDAPVGLLVFSLAVILAVGLRNRRSLMALALAGLGALAAAMPFLLHFTPPVGIARTEIPAIIRDVPLLGTLVTTIGVVTWRPSGAGELLIVHGHWITALALFGVIIGYQDVEIRRRVHDHWLPVTVGLLLTLALAVVWAPGLLLLGVPLAVSVFILVTSPATATRLVAGLFAIGFLLALIPEFLYIQDAFGDRMNTVFKLYFQAWLFFAAATAGTFALAATSGATRVARTGIAVAGVLVIATVPYTPISARDWTDGFQTRHGLDGAVYIQRVAPDDFAAIEWLIASAESDATLVEGPGCSYGGVGGVPMNRVSAFSGVPALIGWIGHERQWRRGEGPPSDARLVERQQVANSWLDGAAPSAPGLPDPAYIVLGDQERAGSDTCESLVGRDTRRSRFMLEATGWSVVFESGDSVILARPEAPE